MKQPRVSEKVEQSHIVQLVETVLGGKAYVLGTRRPKGDHQGTCQTPGVSDLICFIADGRRPGHNNPETLVFVEAKRTGERKADCGRLSVAQKEFRDHCLAAAQHHVVGGYDAFIAWALKEGHLKTSQVPHYRLPAEARD